ncbi:MAG: hypothetical protein NZM35_10460 [Chitinophagales bacterium]|nr:hypothetical protein [Chitinophagales bacterium]MDW8419752.1 hypothetical protein [Chitinophagales bacterium]
MKKTSYILATGTALTLTLFSCNNAEEIAKQKEAEAQKIQQLVDEKLNALKTEAEAECSAKVDSLATSLYNEWVAAEGKKKGAKPVAAVKPKPAPAPKPKEETKVEDNKKGFGGQVNQSGDNKPKGFGGQIQSNQQQENKEGEKPKKKGFGGMVGGN